MRALPDAAAPRGAAPAAAGAAPTDAHEGPSLTEVFVVWAVFAAVAAAIAVTYARLAPEEPHNVSEGGVGWLEQLWKRGTTSFRFPAMQRPDLGLEWLGFVVASAALYALLTRPTLRLRRRA